MPKRGYSLLGGGRQQRHGGRSPTAFSSSPVADGLHSPVETELTSAQTFRRGSEAPGGAADVAGEAVGQKREGSRLNTSSTDNHWLVEDSLDQSSFELEAGGSKARAGRHRRRWSLWACRCATCCCIITALLITAAASLYYVVTPAVDDYICEGGGYNSSMECSTPGEGSSSQYELTSDYSGKDFLDNWDFWSDDDPTHGTVNYVTREEAAARNLTFYDNATGQWYIKSDSENVVGRAARGRDSVRLESREVFHRGLFVIDVLHMPQGCGTWPAFWMYNHPWPTKGEIDIIENTNLATGNAAAMHTSANCSMRHVPTSSFRGAWNPGLRAQPASDCYVKAAHQTENQGCSLAFRENTYGQPFNDGGGGVYATLWDSEGVRVWVFKRGCIPRDLACGRPQPQTWGAPEAHFQLGAECDEQRHFGDLKIVINLTFCGDWAGTSWLVSSCLATGKLCDRYVRKHPHAFKEAYWRIQHVRVYKVPN